MIGLIHPQTYVTQAHLDRENKSLFQPSWLFACLLMELQGRRHYGVKLGNREVILQCDEEGMPRAFLNVCSHRHTRLCQAGGHRGAVSCPYHRWVYNKQGVPTGIPSKEAFPDVVANPEQFRLHEFDCKAVGQFVFVRTASAEGAPGLEEFLGSQYAFLQKASEGMREVTDEFQEDIPANWKAVIENSLEGYHVPTVHSKTFMQIDGMSRGWTAPKFFLDDPRHSYLEHAADVEWLQRFRRMERKIGSWPWQFEHYTHHLIFPNLTVTSFMGYSFHVQRFDPVTPEVTRDYSRTVGVNFEGATAMGYKMMERIYAEGHKFTRGVFAEDKTVCAEVQAGLRQAERFAVIGEGIEDRVLHFHKAYASVMG